MLDNFFNGIQGMVFKVAVALLVGFIGGRFSKKIGLPNVTGYIIFGLFLGPSLGFIIDLFRAPKSNYLYTIKDFLGNNEFKPLISAADSSKLSFISEIALAFIAFSIGVEFSAKSIKKMGKSVLNVALLEVLFALIGVFVLTLFIPKPSIMKNGYQPFSIENISLSLLLASLSSSTAPAATLLVMKQYRAYGPVTKTVLPVTAIDDIIGIIAFGIISSVVQIIMPLNQNADISKGYMIAKPFIEIVVSLSLGAGLGYILKLYFRKTKKDKDETQAVAIAMIIISLAISYFFNSQFKNSKYGFTISPLLANMMLGAIIANFVKKPKLLFESVNNFTTPFFILFFTLAGASLNLNIVKSSGIILLITMLYILGRGFGKYFGCFLGASASKSPATVRKYAGFALFPQGGVSIGLVLLVKQVVNQNMSDLISTIILLSVLVFEITGPLFAKLAIKKAGEINGLDRLDYYAK